ncbi:MAG: Na/Pi cotransporter family protein [Clostridia bacterium]|nr:Na/Pi cotransporter family protein [Clostridia bacterium]
MELKDIFNLITGLAMFLFGMNAMGDGLKRVAGSKLESILWKLSSTPLKGVLLGTGVTAVIQSSSATSCMVVGFVNSGMMTIAQAIGIIMGANIGTTATGWILTLSSVEGGGEAFWTQFLSTTFICAIFALIGTLFTMLCKSNVYKNTGAIMLGFAVLMSGMKMMSGAMDGLGESEMFRDMMSTLSNPFLGILVGTVITAILQSASASIGILQSLAVTGVVSNEAALYLIIGMCIGASMPVLLSAIGATTNGKRASIIYLIFNTIGAIVLTPVFYGLDYFIQFPFMDLPTDAVSIALINTVFNTATTIILLPFVKQFEKLVCALIKEKKSDKATDILDRLDERFLSHPTLAIEQSREVLMIMADKSVNNLLRAMALLGNYNDKDYNIVQEKEEIIDNYEDKLGTYLVNITGLALDKNQSREVSKSLHTIGDFERIADHAVNISHVAKEIHEKKLEFSHEANRELNILSAAIEEIVALSVKSFRNTKDSDIYRIEPLEEMIDLLCDEMKLRHIQRVQSGNCTLNQGFVFSDLITNYERIADHCSNIAVALIELDLDELETHAYLNDLKEHKSAEFINYYDEYKTKYAL